MRALQYSVDELCDNKKSLWIFPQGIIRPPMYRPIEFQTGLAYIAKNVAKKAGGVNLIPVAVNYPFLREDKPEVLCEVGEPIVLTDYNFDRKEFTHRVEKTLKRFATSSLKTSDTATLKITSICTNKNSMV